MRQKIGIVGSREGADLELVERFALELHQKFPDSIVVSGGTPGVCKAAEDLWLGLGGEVWSYRPLNLGFERGWSVAKWELGPSPRLSVSSRAPTWELSEAAEWYAEMVVAEVSDRVVAFYGNQGLNIFQAVNTAELLDKPTVTFERGLHAAVA